MQEVTLNVAWTHDIDFFVDRSLALSTCTHTSPFGQNVWLHWHSWIVKKWEGTTPEVTKYMLAEMYDSIDNKC